MVLGTKYNQALVSQKLRAEIPNINVSLENKIVCILRAMKRKMLTLTAKVFETMENESNYISHKAPAQLSHRRF